MKSSHPFHPSRLAGLLATAALAASLVISPVAITGTALAAVASDQQATIDHAVGTLQDLRHDKAFGTAASLMKRARAVIIAPRIFKAGFFVGGEGGSAVMMTRGAKGWSDPAFYTIGSASFGLQIGAQESEMIMFIMSDRALQAVLNNEFKIGANADIAVATLGSSVEAATTSNLNADIIAWASASGAYAGLTLNGTVISPRAEADSAYYGRSLTTKDIVEGGKGHNPGASKLVQALDSIG